MAIDHVGERSDDDLEKLAKQWRDSNSPMGVAIRNAYEFRQQLATARTFVANAVGKVHVDATSEFHFSGCLQLFKEIEDQMRLKLENASKPLVTEADKGDGKNEVRLENWMGRSAIDSTTNQFSDELTPLLIAQNAMREAEDWAANPEWFFYGKAAPIWRFRRCKNLLKCQETSKQIHDNAEQIAKERRQFLIDHTKNESSIDESQIVVSPDDVRAEALIQGKFCQDEFNNMSDTTEVGPLEQAAVGLAPALRAGAIISVFFTDGATLPVALSLGAAGASYLAQDFEGAESDLWGAMAIPGFMAAAHLAGGAKALAKEIIAARTAEDFAVLNKLGLSEAKIKEIQEWFQRERGASVDRTKLASKLGECPC